MQSERGQVHAPATTSEVREKKTTKTPRAGTTRELPRKKITRATARRTEKPKPTTVFDRRRKKHQNESSEMAVHFRLRHLRGPRVTAQTRLNKFSIVVPFKKAMCTRSISDTGSTLPAPPTAQPSDSVQEGGQVDP